jgi:hypothetical protein
MVADWIGGLKQRTGKSLDEWLSHIRAKGPKGTDARVAWLKREHSMGTNYALWFASRAEGAGAEDGDPDAYLTAAAGYVEALYAGPKAALRPIHDALLDLAFSVGGDVKVCPCQTMVPIFRNHVIAQVKPATRTRIDFGLALGDTKASGRLVDTGGFAKKDRITHKIEITSAKDIDADVKRWLRAAYERDGAPRRSAPPKLRG